MTNDTERREVARRLRDSAEERMVVKGKGTGNNWSWLYQSIFGHCMGVAKGAKGRYAEVVHRLADLIDPSDPKVECVAEVKVDGERLEELVHDAAAELTGIDRDALLELARICEDTGYMYAKVCVESTNDEFSDLLRSMARVELKTARVIREACGVER